MAKRIIIEEIEDEPEQPPVFGIVALIVFVLLAALWWQG